ncbi:MAG: ATP-binding cassette domain-containing protein [Rhizobacter sp.]|nr:ATP-binding cassette domain-containing protein [Ferruginibacter sp.]
MYNSQPDKEIVISIHGLYKSFDECPVLQGINMEVYKSENVIVLGPSGSGKSVLIKLIAGLLKPEAGSVKVMGKEVGKLDKRELMGLRTKIGFSFQGSALYDSMTVYENMEFALVRQFKNMHGGEVRKTIREMLEAIGLGNAKNKMPSELSGGQKKRIGIARTLILRPEIMLYDEPTAGLDPVTSGGINDLINEVQIKNKTTSIIITHDLTCAKKTGDRLFIMHNGKFIKEGSFDEVFASKDERIKPFYDYNFTQ